MEPISRTVERCPALTQWLHGVDNEEGRRQPSLTSNRSKVHTISLRLLSSYCGPLRPLVRARTRHAPRRPPLTFHGRSPQFSIRADIEAEAFKEKEKRVRRTPALIRFSEPHHLFQTSERRGFYLLSAICYLLSGTPPAPSVLLHSNWRSGLPGVEDDQLDWAVCRETSMDSADCFRQNLASSDRYVFTGLPLFHGELAGKRRSQR